MEAQSLHECIRKRPVLVAGGGPVGLLSACLLGARGVPVLVVSETLSPSAWSRAIGISPPSLEILAGLGLDGEFIRQGRPIRDVSVHSQSRLLGEVDFRGIHPDYDFILSIPQTRTEAILAEYARTLSTVQVLRGWRLELAGPISAGLPGPSGQELLVLRKLQGGEGLVVDAKMVLVCQGARSNLRHLVEPDTQGRRYGDTFVMADHDDQPELQGRAHLFFTPQGAVESFPLPDGRRRWIVQTAGFVEKPEPGFVSRTAAQRIHQRGFSGPDPASEADPSPFGVQRLRMRHYHYRLGGRDFLFLGDAAHLMSPIGGQGMNTGFGDADWFAPLVEAAWKTCRNLDRKDVRQVEAWRKRSFQVAANRAALSMKLGTIRGRVGSFLREGILALMIRGPFAGTVPVNYAMLSIPRRNRRSHAMGRAERNQG